MDTDFIPLLPEGKQPAALRVASLCVYQICSCQRWLTFTGARWGDISDAEEEAPAGAAADGHDEFETDPKRLTSRQQQIDFGKNTLGYERYLQAVPKHKRKLRGKDHDPPTPDITQKLSKRTWDGIVSDRPPLGLAQLSSYSTHCWHADGATLLQQPFARMHLLSIAVQVFPQTLAHADQ
eukprot:GHRQ01030297.1.p1 GENE.GHRQ01030297.1~~GHRQ01030297.1.p1  ORF type:complete len:180 (+),score=23.28 GHRQ01030297.1:400-939(+)